VNQSLIKRKEKERPSQKTGCLTVGMPAMIWRESRTGSRAESATSIPFMNNYVQIKSDITPEVLPAKVHEYARQCVEEAIRSKHAAHGAVAHAITSHKADIYGSADLVRRPALRIAYAHPKRPSDSGRGRLRRSAAARPFADLNQGSGVSHAKREVKV
jgi:hypothetical protein